MKKLSAAFILILTIVFTACHNDEPEQPRDRVNPADREILMNIYTVLHLEYFREYDGWRENAVPEKWHGVTFEFDPNTGDYRAVKVDVPYKNSPYRDIQEQTAVDQEALNQLARLDSLHYFELYLPYVDNIDIPEDIFTKRLISLQITGYNLKSNVTTGNIRKLSSDLKILQLSSMWLENDVLDVVLNLDADFEVLNLSGNHFSGKVPYEITKFKNADIRLRSNGFTEFDWRFADLPLDRIPYLYENHIDGPLPSPSTVPYDKLKEIMYYKLGDNPIYWIWYDKYFLLNK